MCICVTPTPLLIRFGRSPVVFKDLGPQIGYQLVFFWEYFGPLVIFPLFYFFRREIYPASALPAGGALPPAHLAQTVATAFWVGHYAKRLLETFFVHSFSHATMPLSNLFKNCAYYWGFAAAVSYFVNHPLYTPPVREDLIWGGLVLGVLSQLSNLYCHIILRRLRGDGKAGGDGAYQIPRGFLFEWVTCANYTTEVFSWFAFNVISQTLLGYAFMLAGALQMSLWAIAKHKRLRTLFDGKDGREKYPRRWVIFPPIL